MDNIKSECPGCKSKELKNIIADKDGSDNIDNIGHFHLECRECGYRFNLWKCESKILIGIYGDIYKLYL